MKSTGTFKPVVAIFLLLVLLVQAGCSPARETAGVLLERELEETLQGAGIQYHRVLAFVPAPAGQKDLALIFYQLPGGLGASLVAKTTSGWALLGSGTARPGSGPEKGLSWTCSNLGKGERSFPVFYGVIAEPKITGVELELVNGKSVGAEVVETTSGGLRVWFVPPDINTIPGKTAKVLKPPAVAVVGLSRSGEVLYTSDRDTVAPEHQAHLKSIQMVDENTGWAMDGRSLLRTSDGGRNWADVTPPGAGKAVRGLELEFLDASTAWVAVSSDSKPQLTIFRTADSGRNWSGTVVEKKSGGNLYGAYLDFIDAKHGWLMIEPEHGMSSRPGELYQTGDGGDHWSLVSLSGGRDRESRLPFSGPVGFRDASNGWLPGRPGAAFIPDHPLYVTRDGGRSWQPQNLPLPPGCEGGGWLDIISPPVFFSPPDKETGFRE
ncbi:MAG: WD40/YVTN/BNR-like repeat-containing protein [Bacillota bacterium]